MLAKVTSDLLQLLTIFLILGISILVLIAGLMYLDSNSQPINKWWRARVKFIRETNWLGVFLIVGLILLFMCNGPIIIF